MANQLEVRGIEQMDNVVFVVDKKTFKAADVEATIKQSSAQMRDEKAGVAGADGVGAVGAVFHS